MHICFHITESMDIIPVGNYLVNFEVKKTFFSLSEKKISTAFSVFEGCKNLCENLKFIFHFV